MKKLWNRNFKLAFAGMIISAMGGVGLSIALSVVVFSETQSAWLSAVFASLTFLPDFILPLMVGPFIDRRNPLRVLVTNEVILVVVFISAAFLIHLFGFNYWLYLGISLITSCLGVVSNLASNSVIPQIMDRSNYSRGYAILSVIYPLSSVLVTPIAMRIYTEYGVVSLMLIYAALTLVDAFMESRIDAKFEFIETDSVTLKSTIADTKEAFEYLKGEQALRAVFTFFFWVTVSSGIFNVIHYPFFNTSAVLNDSHYSILMSVMSAGYMAGGFIQYSVRIPDKIRYTVAFTVYLIFVVLDSAYFYVGFAGMCIIRFVLGIAGSNSANIRHSATQARINPLYRAKVNGFFGILTSMGQIIGQLLAGFLAASLSYPFIQILGQFIYLLSALIFILPPKNKVKELYNYDTRSEEELVAN